MFILSDTHLPQLLEILRPKFPATLNIYYLVKNKIKLTYAWPGIEFLVDQFPEVTVCIARTSAQQTTDFPPLVNGYTVFVYSNNVDNFRAAIKEPGIVDWTQRISFLSIENPDYSRILKEHCEEIGGRTANDNENDFFIEHSFYMRFDLEKLEEKSYSLPAGYRVGELTSHHAAQLTEEKNYGILANNYQFFKYVLENGYPSAALFNEENVAIAYLIYRPDGCFGAGYVSPKYRGRGFYKVVSYEILKKLKGKGETEAYCDVTYGNIASIRALTAVGGVSYEGNNDFQCFGYIPPEPVTL